MDFSDLYLNDGHSQIDYVIVYNNEDVTKRRFFKRIFENLLADLDEFNFAYEISKSLDKEDLRCLKIHVPSIILEEYANLQYIEIAYKSKSPQIGEYLQWCGCMHTPLTLPNPENAIWKRFREITSDMESPLTQAERILLSYIALANVRFGKGIDERGIERILNLGVVKAIFPLHEGNSDWTEDGPLTERQLLSRYWSGLRNLVKIQPLNAIEKYFGPEMAFLYAFLQLTIEMQTVASVLGLLFFILGVSAESSSSKAIRDYICSSGKLMCPTCNPKICKPKSLRTYCGIHFRIFRTFDNAEMFMLGVCISLWGTFFMEIWKRRQTLYRLRWNVASMGNDLEIRTGYEKRAKLLVASPFMNELEPAMSTPDVVARVFVSAASVILLICCVLVLEILVIMMKMELKILIHKYELFDIIQNNDDVVVKFAGSGATVAVILVIDEIYQVVSKFLTDWENPRTQKQYDNSFMLKCFLFAFANNYLMLLYIAFFKGRFFTNPGDETMYDIKGAYIADTCVLGECDADLADQVIFILGVKHVFKCIAKCVYKIGIVVWKKYNRNKKSTDSKYEQWEKDYILKSFGRYDIMKQYIEIILRHGMVLFFTSVCPFTPLLTLIVNLLEMRLYSYAYTHFFRRPIPRKVEGIEMFNFILQALTWFGVTVNAVLALMTKNFAKMYFFMKSVDYNITAFMDKKFSAFSMNDYKSPYISEILNSNNISVCYYPGNRYPPEDVKKYKEHTDSQEYNCFGWMMIVLYLHLVFVLTRLIAQFVPDSSSDVRDYLNSLHSENKKAIRKFRNQQFQSRKSLNTFISEKDTDESLESESKSE